MSTQGGPEAAPPVIRLEISGPGLVLTAGGQLPFLSLPASSLPVLSARPHHSQTAAVLIAALSEASDGEIEREAQ